MSQRSKLEQIFHEIEAESFSASIKKLTRHFKSIYSHVLMEDIITKTNPFFQKIPKNKDK